MSETHKLIFGLAGVILIGFLVVGTSKQKSPEQIEAAAMIRNYAAMQSMANKKCPAAIEKATGEQVFYPASTESDKETYITMRWEGETDKFKTASCTLNVAKGGISELIVDDKVIIGKK